MTERRQLFAAATTLALATTTAGAQPARPLTGRTALVTGAARGIGRATALALARLGADVALLDIAEPDAIPALRGYRLATRAELDEAVRLTAEEQVRTLPLVADIRDADALRAAAKRLDAELGGPDILVANAGIAINGNLAEPDPAAWQAMLDVNLTGTLNTIQAMLAGMRRRGRGGRIVITTSVQARMGARGSGAYAATKWALTGLMKSLAAELGPEEITVNAVAPTAVETPMVHRGGDAPQPDPRRAAAFAGHALPIPVLPPSQVADAIAFLCGPGALYVSGTTLDVNAGRSAQLTA
ncbi:SDR family oxidoreductase [Belnapia sp. T18]|uniref:SDR family oxidoreductase n=1 Tax=Belnapia arida TaxID=2804533 RepID=A0ABS1TVA3_9PROT|nr:SDR family oxidoreductase [Belnapia arida]MBL6076363.1 SDR family oxidoreductase [Belnapia arida]